MTSQARATPAAGRLGDLAQLPSSTTTLAPDLWRVRNVSERPQALTTRHK